MIFVLFLTFFSSCSAKSFRNNEAPIVNTSYGLIQGYSEFNSFVYLGIPFAQPPVNGLRWKNPVEPKPWIPNTYNATIYQAACPQPRCGGPICPPKFGEDCLYLNIYVPQTIKNGEKKAVMFFLHGGNFQYYGGNAALFNSTFYAAIGDVVVVTINYRLGALGFLLTGLEDDQAHGNFGVLDQKMALKWVYENIEAFGGDNQKITIFGQSAGAESVTIHILSSDMQPYFKNAIIQSSPMSIPFKSFEEMMSLYTYFADLLNCSARDMACLRNKTIDEIVSAQMKSEGFVSSVKLLDFFEQWLPWVDGKTIKGQLLEIDKWISNDTFELKPFMISTLTEECVLYVYGAWSKPDSTKEYLLVIAAAMKTKAVKILERFPPNLNTTDQRELMSNLATKWVFTCSSRNFLENYMSHPRSNKNIFYVSIFDFPLDFNGWGDGSFCNKRVCHGADQPYTFDIPDANFTSMGHKIAIEHIQYWSNYAKSESPNSNETLTISNKSENLLYWPKYENQSKLNLRFIAPENIIENNYSKEDCDFLDKIGYYH